MAWCKYPYRHDIFMTLRPFQDTPDVSADLSLDSNVATEMYTRSRMYIFKK